MIVSLSWSSTVHGQTLAPAKDTIAVDAYNHIAVTADRIGTVRLSIQQSRPLPSPLSAYTAPTELTGVALPGIHCWFRGGKESRYSIPLTLSHLFSKG